MESFKLPMLGKFFHSLRPTTMYSDMALKLVGLKDLIQNNEIAVGNDFDEAVFHKLATLYSFVKNRIGTDEKDVHLVEIRQSIDISLKSINEILAMVAKIKYKNMKKQMFEVSSSAVVANLKKYHEQVYEN